MAVRAIGGCESRSGSRVCWVVGALPGGEVALRVATIARCNLQRIVAIDVAGRTRHIRVSVGQQESRGAVIEHACRPRGDRMTGSALRRSRGETCRNVIRNIPANRGGAGVRGCVAAIAVRRT